jgi:hypothetical protein
MGIDQITWFDNFLLSLSTRGGGIFIMFIASMVLGMTLVNKANMNTQVQTVMISSFSAAFGSLLTIITSIPKAANGTGMQAKPTVSISNSESETPKV